MWLALRLIVRLVGVVAFCLAFAVACAMVDTHRSIDRATSASADRVAAQLEILYWRELMWRGGLHKERLLPTPEWQTLATLKLVSPGVCVAFAPGSDEPTRLCGQVEGVGEQAPVWFKSIYEGMLGPQASLIAPSRRAKLTLGRSSLRPTLKLQSSGLAAGFHDRRFRGGDGAGHLCVCGVGHRSHARADRRDCRRPAPVGAWRLPSTFAAVSRARVCPDRVRRQ